MDKSITISIRANVENFKKSMAGMKESVKKAGDSIKEESQKMSEDLKKATSGKGGKFQGFAESMKGISPTLDKAVGSASELKDRLGSAGKKGRLAMLGLKAGVLGVVGVIGVKLGKALLSTTGKFAKMSDPVRFDKASSEMQASVRKLKTAIGTLASPVFEWLAKGASSLANALTWVVEKIAMLVAGIQGLLGLGSKANQTIKGTTDEMKEATESANSGLSSFDKLSTVSSDGMGDMAQATKMEESMEKMRKKAEAFRNSISNTLKPLTSILGKIKDFMSLSPDEKWEAVKTAIEGVWNYIKKQAKDFWADMKAKAHRIVSGFVSSITGIGQKILDFITSIPEKVVEIGGQISEAFFGVIDGIVAWAGETFGGFFEGLINAIKGLPGKIVEVGTDIKNSVFKFLGEVKDKAITKVKEVFKPITDKITGVKDSFFSVIGKIKSKIDEAVEKVFGPMKDKVEEIKSLFTSIPGKFEEIWNKVYGKIQEAIQWILNKIKWITDTVEGVKDTVGGVGDKIGGAFSGVTNAIGGIFGFAKGGLFQPNSPQLVMVGDNKTEPEVIAPRSMIMDAMRQVIAETGGGRSQAQDITLTIDGKTLARYTFDDIQSEGRRRGMMI